MAIADATIHPFLPTFKKATKKLEDRVVVLGKVKTLTGRRSGDVLIRRFVLFISPTLLDLDNKNYFCFYFHNTTLKNNAYPVCLNVTPGALYKRPYVMS